jgi:hypothetical protein
MSKKFLMEQPAAHAIHKRMMKCENNIFETRCFPWSEDNRPPWGPSLNVLPELVMTPALNIFQSLLIVLLRASAKLDKILELHLSNMSKEGFYVAFTLDAYPQYRVIVDQISHGCEYSII